MGVNTGVQLATREEGQKLDHGSIVVSGLTGGLSTGASIWGTVAVNTGGAFSYQKIKGEEAEAVTVAAALGSFIGYGIGSKVVEKSINPVFNPIRNQYKFIPANGTDYMFTLVPRNPTPGVVGSIIGSSASEYTVKYIKDTINEAGSGRAEK